MATLNSEKSWSDIGFVIFLIWSASYTISSAALDAGNTGITHILRAGLCLGMVTATGELKEYDDGDADGTETLFGILLQDVDLKRGDPAASAADTPAMVMLAGTVKETDLIGIDANGKLDVDETTIAGFRFKFE